MDYALIGRDGKGTVYTITTGSRHDMQALCAYQTARFGAILARIGKHNKRTTGDRMSIPTDLLRGFEIVTVTPNLAPLLADTNTQLIHYRAA